MASSMLALKRPLSSQFDLRRALLPLGASIVVTVPPPQLSRPFITNAQLPNYVYGGYERSLDLDRPGASFDSGGHSTFASNATTQPSPPLSSSFTKNSPLLAHGYGDYGRALGLDRPADYLESGKRSMFPDIFDPLWPRMGLRQALSLTDGFVANLYPSASHCPGAGSRCGWDVKETADALHLRLDMPGLAKDHVKITAEQATLVIDGEGEKEAWETDTAANYICRIDLPEKIFKTDAIKAEMKNGVLKVTVPKVKEEERTDVHRVKVE
ncbi:hypothetical protein Ancab_008787 [Ancistrocladus abbreviatus]